MLNRYELSDAKNAATSDHVLEIWCYEAYRLFRDRLVGVDAVNKFDNIMATIVRSEWSANVFDNIASKNIILPMLVLHKLNSMLPSNNFFIYEGKTCGKHHSNVQ